MWTRVDAAQDEPFENRVSRQAATDLDAAFLAAPPASGRRCRFLALLRTYVVTDLGYRSQQLFSWGGESG